MRETGIRRDCCSTTAVLRIGEEGTNGVMKTSAAYRVLSWTWGLPMTLVGCLAAGCLWLAGHRPERWGGGIYFVVGKHWGGVSLGPVTLVSTADERLLTHEFGHSIQNCRWGFLYPVAILLPSAVRYWYRRAILRLGLREQAELPEYYEIWFEAGADRLGREAMERWGRNPL